MATEETKADDKGPQKPTKAKKAARLGHNDQAQLNSVRSLLVPSVSELVLLSVIVLLVLVAANNKEISHVLSTAASVNPNDASALQPQFDYLNSIFQNQFFAQAAVWLVWGIVGAVSYMAVWGLRHFYLQIR